MAIKRSHLICQNEAACDGTVRRLGVPMIPALLGVLAVLNVASVVMVLME